MHHASQVAIYRFGLFAFLSWTSLWGRTIDAQENTGGPGRDRSRVAEQARRPPNVLMICVDDLNDWVGYLGGHPQASTPNLDALAAKAHVFDNAHCVVPVCSPSRISVISGLHATTHGSYELGPSYTSIRRLDEQPTLHAYFKSQGYRTLSGGKVLHGGFKGRLARDIDVTLVKRHGGPRPPSPMNWQPRVWDFGGFPDSDEEMYDFQLAQAAASALQSESDQPFFLSVGFFRPHVPMYVPPKWFEQFPVDGIELPLVPADDLADLPGNFTAMPQVAPTHQQIVDAGKWSGFVQAYLASTSFVDHCVGLVMRGLERSPHRNNTIVVLWSDHGFHLGEKQHWAKRTLWEESTRVPLIVMTPESESNGVCSEPVSLLDIYPTLIELCGLPARDDLDGVSLVPQLRDRMAARESPVLTSSYEGNHSLRSRDWRYIRYADGAEELYDHRVDPGEFRNLAEDAEHESVKASLANFLPEHPAPEVIPLKERRKREQAVVQKRGLNRPVSESPQPR